LNIVWAGSKEPMLCRALIQWTSRMIWPEHPNKELPDGIAMGVFEDDTIAGCVVFHNWEPDAGVIEMSAAAQSRRWLTRKALDEMFEYAFRTVGVQMAVTRVSAREGQKHLHRIFRAYGFDEIRIPRLYGREEDGILFMLTDDKWKRSKFYRSEVA